MTSKDRGPAARPTDEGSATGPVAPDRATLVDVARLANVSTKTVSRALFGSGPVSPATKEKVERAAAALRFRPNALARELRTGGATTTVGFVIGDLTNPFYTRVGAGVQRALTRHGLTLIIAATADDPRLEPTAVSAMLERRVRALLLVPVAEDHSYLEGERQFGTPIVAVDRPLTNAVSDSVVFDNRSGARAGVVALLEAGHRRVGFVGPGDSLYTQRERLRGYRDALEARGLPFDPTLIRTVGRDVASTRAATRELLEADDPPTAVFAGDNRAAIGVLEEARGSTEPLGLVGFDDFDLADLLGVSVVAHDPERMGEEAAEIALRRISEPMGVVERVILPTQVVLRGSERRIR